MPGKVTKGEKRRRVYKIVGLMLDGFSHADILRVASEKTDWGVSDRQVEYYMSEAGKIIEKKNRQTFEEKRAVVEKRLLRWIAKAVLDRDMRLARQLNKDYIELFGLNAPLKIEDVTKPQLKYADEADNRLEEIIQEARQIIAE